MFYKYALLFNVKFRTVSVTYSKIRCKILLITLFNKIIFFSNIRLGIIVSHSFLIEYNPGYRIALLCVNCFITSIALSILRKNSARFFWKVHPIKLLHFKIAVFMILNKSVSIVTHRKSMSEDMKL